MWQIRQVYCVFIFLCIVPIALSEEQGMNRQQQCTEYGVYQDTSENWIDCSEEAYIPETYVEESYAEEPDVDESYVEDTYTEEPYQEDVYTEEVYDD